MPKGSRALRFISLIELVTSVGMLIWMVYLYFDYRSSPAKALMDALNSNYGMIRLLLVIYEAYKLGVAAYIIKRGDYAESASPIIVNGFILGGASGFFFYYAISDFINVRNLLNSGFRYLDYSTWRETVTLISASIDLIAVVVIIVAGFMNKPKTVIVNSWGAGSHSTDKYNIPPAAPQSNPQPGYYNPQPGYYNPQQSYDSYAPQDGYTQQDYYTQGTYDNSQDYGQQ